MLEHLPWADWQARAEARRRDLRDWRPGLAAVPTVALPQPVQPVTLPAWCKPLPRMPILKLPGA